MTCGGAFRQSATSLSDLRSVQPNRSGVSRKSNVLGRFCGVFQGNGYNERGITGTRYAQTGATLTH